MEGDNSHVEMKLSSDIDEEVGGNGVGDHLNHNSNRKPYVAQKLGRTPKNLCFMAAATLLIFIIGKRGLFIKLTSVLKSTVMVTWWYHVSKY